MAKYNLLMSELSIQQTRSTTIDTLVGSIGLRVMNAEGGVLRDWPAQSRDMGEGQAHQTIFRLLFFPEVDIPDPTPESPDGGAVYWSFILVNSSRSDNTTLTNALENATGAVVGAFQSTANIVAEVASGTLAGTQELAQMLNTGCDGIVAAQSWALTGAELANMIANKGDWTDVQNYSGMNNPTGCGATSNYNVSYSISAGPAVTVPNLIGLKFDDAQDIARDEGLGVEVIKVERAYDVEVPTVKSQFPFPNSLVPPDAWIKAIDFVPPPGPHPESPRT